MRESPGASSKPPEKRTNPRHSFATDEIFAVKSILDESSDKYLIDWEDDPVTGRSYSPTWEPKANANDAAVNAWERRQYIGSHNLVEEKTIYQSSGDS